MTDAPDLTDVRAALAALEGGTTNVAQFEALLVGALRGGVLTAADAAAMLHEAVTKGLVPAGVMVRLQLSSPAAESRATQETRLRVPARSTHDSPPPPSPPPGTSPPASPTRLRPAPRLMSAPPAAPDSSDGPGAAAKAGGAETRFRPSAPTPAVETGEPSGATSAGDGAAPTGDSVSQWTEPEAGARSAPAELETGRVLGGRYLLERKLGEGGMGVVFFASDQEVKGENFAIKVLKPEIREHPEALALLREEVRKTRALGHPNIVGVYSLNSDSDCVYMLMEYLEGKPLDVLLDEDFGRGLPFERAWPLIQDVGAALAFAHDHSVIHSDLKPANVFVTTGGKAKLVDFGIARAARGRPRGVDPGALGALTPAYASCEMLEEAHEPDSRDDIYALACVIYEMLSGKHPFGGRTAVEARDEKRRPAPLPSLSRVQNAAVTKALAFDREQRTASVESLVAGLAPGASSGRRPAVMLAVAATIVTVAAIGWWAWTRSQQPAPSPAGLARTVDARTSAALAHVRDLAEQARKTEIDEADPSLVQGLQLLHTAEQQLAVGAAADGARSLAAADGALRSALRGGARVAHIGSGPEEVQLALNLCRQRGAHCTLADFADEAPRSVVLHPFVLDLTGVTNSDFATFAEAHGYKTEAERGGGLYAVAGSQLVARPSDTWRTLRDHDAAAGNDASAYPVRGIDFESARAYCASLGKRLPTEEEWEFMARPDHRIFPWGNDPVPPKGAGPPRLLPVSEQFPTGRFGARGLGGMLWEWVDGGTPAERVFRGASWLETDPVHQRLAMRGLENPARAHVDTGFRCARSTDAWPEPEEAGAH